MTESQMDMTVPELTEAIIPYIESKNYSESYMKGFRLILTRLENYCAEKGITKFSTEVGQQFILEKYGVISCENFRKHSRLIRTMDMLSDFQHSGTVMIKRRLKRAFRSLSGMQKHICIIWRKTMPVQIQFFHIENRFSSLRIFLTVKV